MEKSETLKKDIEFCDQFIDISETAKRIVRVSTKTYETSCTYVAIKLFRRNNQSDDDYKFSQRVNLSLSEFDRLVEHIHRIRDLIDSKDTEVPLTVQTEPPKVTSKAIKRKEGENDKFSQHIRSTNDTNSEDESQPLSKVKKNLAHKKNLAYKIEKYNG